MQILLNIDPARAWAITAAREAANAEMPQTVDGPEGDDGQPTQVPNPALWPSDAAYLVARLDDVVRSYERQHAPSAPPPAPTSAPAINGVPQAVDMVKAEVYFVRIGVDAQVKAAIQAAGAEAQAIWLRSKTVQRHNSLVLHIAYNVLGWTPTELDGHFVAADQVVI